MLILGSTRFMGKHLAWRLIEKGHDVTIATRGKTQDDFGDKLKRDITEDEFDPLSYPLKWCSWTDYDYQALSFLI